MGPEVIERWKLAHEPQQEEFTQWIRGEGLALDAGMLGILERHREQLFRMHQVWNETELLANFIAPVMNAIDFQGVGYNLFYERKLSVRLAAGLLKGTVDGLVASGLIQPETPYFFIHEYKRVRAPEADPQGQLLVTTLAAQHLNAESDPLYGCYIVGRIWTFVFLTGRTFAEWQGYDASDPGELRIVLAILQATKRRIEARVAAAG
jgi:hypothetical protein